MSDHDSFEDRIRAMAEQISRSVEKMSEVDFEEIAEKYGVDPDRARSFADAAGQWLNDRLSNGDPLFGRDQRAEHDSATPGPSAGPEAQDGPAVGRDKRPTSPGPHPLDLPTEWQGRALSALDSGRWAVRPGSNTLAGTGEGPPPPDPPDLVSDLRARDWISAEGTLTLVGRHALARWCRAADEPASPAGPDAPRT